MEFNTGTVRLSFVRLIEPRVEDNGKKQYTAQILIDKKDKWTLEAFKEAVAALKRDPKALNTWGGKADNVRIPLRDGDKDQSDTVKKYPETYAGKYFMNVKSSKKPIIFDQTGGSYFSIEDEEKEIYSGCYARVRLNLSPYSFSGNKGITCYVNLVKKVRDGEPLGGGLSTAEAFDDGYQDEGGDLESILA